MQLDSYFTQQLDVKTIFQDQLANGGDTVFCALGGSLIKNYLKIISKKEGFLTSLSTFYVFTNEK